MRQYLASNGRTLAYLDSHAAQGRGAAKGVRPASTLLLLHAFPLNADMWQPQFEAVPPGWRLVAPDLAGFGESSFRSTPDLLTSGPPDRRTPGPQSAQGFNPASDAGVAQGISPAGNAGVAQGFSPASNAGVAQGFSPASPSFDDDAGDLIALLDHLGISRAVVAGLSMGGYVAFALYRRAASRVAGLVLANTRATADTSEARAGRRQMMARVGITGVGEVADEMLPRLLGETTRRERPELASRVRGIVVANGVEGVRRAIACMMDRPDSTPLLARLSCPVLVVASDEDTITPPATAREMAAAIPGSSFAVVPGAGHLSNLEGPDAFNGALHRFLGHVRATAC